MKSSIIQAFLLILTAASTTVAGPVRDAVYERHESEKRKSESVVLDARGTQIVPAVILGLTVGGALLGQFLYTIKSKPEATVKPDSSNPKEGAIQMMQEAVNYLSQHSDFTSMAVRSTVTHGPGLEGEFKKDWGSSDVTIEAAEGTSKWTIYWGKKGFITVNTPNLAQDVVLGGSTSSNRDPNDSNKWTITITK